MFQDYIQILWLEAWQITVLRDCLELVFISDNWTISKIYMTYKMYQNFDQIWGIPNQNQTPLFEKRKIFIKVF